ncbi:hypothetical protein CFP75_23525 [Amycolatopsis alba DSM 44262]|uniref:Uncharacterized protein n=2 Tax=Amycolatopsis alba TaxID=76020 RepID=A0A229RM03_AMYAL|nr:hypothetical protein CFP75_23525 [Amycolatopsis alba DSM 44262]
METHPDLLDPEWRSRAERDARRGAKKELRQRRKQTPRRRFRRGFRMSRGRRVLVLFLALTVVLLVAATIVVRQLRDTGSGQPPKAAPVPVGVDLDRPYDRTPAATWGEGLAGIIVPPGQAVGDFTAEEVDAAYRKATEAIAAARLGSRALGGDGSELLALLNPNERARLEATLTSAPTVEKGKYLTLIGPNRLLPARPRMIGSLTAKAARKGELIVHASYVTAYAFDVRPGDARSPVDIVPFVRDEEDYMIRKEPSFAKGDAGLGLGDSAGFTSRMACDAIKTGVLAPQYADKGGPVYGAPAVEEAATYDPTKPLPTRDACG